MADPILDEVNLTTRQEIYPKVVVDQFFRKTPFQAYLRDHCLEPFGGGSFMQNVFIYAPMIGGAYAVGDSWNINKRQTLAGTIFEQRYYETAVPEYQEIIQTVNAGPLKVYSLIDLDLRNAMNTITGIVAVDLSLHGQPVGTGVAASRVKHLNGWVEAVNNGLDPSWDGNRYPTYGTQPRNGVIGTVMNSTPRWGGDAAGATGPITYPVFEEMYQDASIGDSEPDLILMNKALYAYAKERIQLQQRFAQEKDPIWGAHGWRFNSAMVLKDDYFPSAVYGANDPDLGNYLTGTVTVPVTVTAASGLPIAGTICTVGEVVGMFTTKRWLFRISDDPLYGFGFSGFIPTNDSSKVVGTVRAMVNLECLEPRVQKMGYGFGG